MNAKHPQSTGRGGGEGLAIDTKHHLRYNFIMDTIERASKTKPPQVEVVPIESLQPDPHNANEGTERGSYMLNDS